MKLKQFLSENLSLEYHKELNPKIFDLGSDNAEPVMWSEVRTKLLELAKSWQEFAKIDVGLIKDVILTGGNANYNYTKFSDIDIHLVIDYSKLSSNDNFILEYMMDKKLIWSVNHPDIRIKGYPVELFAQDSKDHPHPGQGIYSVLFDRWIISATNEKLDFSKNFILQHKVDVYKKKIEDLINNKTTDETALQNLKDKLKSMRGAAIEKFGEYSVENLLFKELRNDGYIQKLSDYLRKIKDKELSLESTSFKQYLNKYMSNRYFKDENGILYEFSYEGDKE